MSYELIGRVASYEGLVLLVLALLAVVCEVANWAINKLIWERARKRRAAKESGR